jgi:hypothetical protein
VAFFATWLSVLRLSPRLNRGVIVKSDTALAATNDDKFASLTDIEVAQTGSKREGWSHLRTFRAIVAKVISASISWTLSVLTMAYLSAVCQKEASLQQRAWFP